MILAQWLFKRFGLNVLYATLALAALLALFDLLAHAGQVTAEANGLLLPLLNYVLLRFPPIVVFILPFAVLIAALQTFAKLAAQQEIVALQSAGFNLYRIVAVLVAAVIGLSALEFVFADRIVTASAARLAEWEADDYRGLPNPEIFPEKPKWLGSEPFIAHLDDVSPDGARLDTPTLIWRDEKGKMTRYLKADSARYRDGRWFLTGVFERDLKSGEVRRLANLPVDIDLKPLHFASLNQEVASLRFSELLMLGSGKVETQIHTPRHYHMAALQRIAHPLSAAIMVLLAAPVALQINRRGYRIAFSVLAMTLGFLYFVAERILLTMGEAGELSVAPAVWGPPALFGLIGLGVMISQQR